MTLNIEQIAQIAHETNRAYCASIGDHTQPAWADAPDWQKQSAIKGVVFHLAQHAAGVTPSPSASHDCWLAERAADGWAYGPIKDPVVKLPPCFLPYEELPAEQRLKDYLFGSVVAAFHQAA